MRIVIDMQGAQASNRDRGIGRYTMSLVQSIVRNRGEHEVILALSGLFPKTIEPIRAAFYGQLPEQNIRVWQAVSPVAYFDTKNNWRRQSVEYLREAFLASLQPDVVHVTSLFEGFGDDAVSSIGKFSKFPTAITLYDLIPYIHREHYLENATYEAWYLEKIEHLHRADLLLAISESSRKESIKHLNLSESHSVNVSTDADKQFQLISISTESEQTIRLKYRLHRPFVMYTGGIDHRKNIEGLIQAYAKLPASIRQDHQLAIVCSVQEISRHKLERLAAQCGLVKDEMILTGFVPEDDLVALYNLCELFVFPSWHEGFGLPVLEAMRCGAPVIGANTSSIPEVIGLDEALFDPHSVEDISDAIERVLLDPAHRQALINHSKVKAQTFSWDDSAQRAIAAMEKLHAAQRANSEKLNDKRRLKLAYLSPLPSERSGIADYSAELLPELAQFYEIDVITDQDIISDPWIHENCVVRSVQWFSKHADGYDRVLYHFGNSSYHQHMFSLLEKVPGVIVLHDFYLSGITAHIDMSGYSPGYWAQELYNSHGYSALSERFHAEDTADIVWKYPCSLSVIQDSLGVIVHSENSLRLAKHWYGFDASDWVVIPLLRNSNLVKQKISARQGLGFTGNEFVVCAFGILGPAKLNHRLLNSWIKSKLAVDESCHLIFVGENDPSHYGKTLLNTVSQSGLKERVHITGWSTQHVYREYLAAADVGIQLRALSRGETSAAVLDCMNYGLPTIINANGSMADISDDAVWKLPDEFTDEQLIEALETLWQSSERRRALGDIAREAILEKHSPQLCAEQYRNAIERFYEKPKSRLPKLYKAIAQVPGQPNDSDLVQLANALAKNHPPDNKQRQLLIDISELVQRDARTGIQRVVRSILLQWLLNPPSGYRVEPVYATVDEHGYRYARRYTQQFLDINARVLSDDPIDYNPGDIFFALDLQPQVQVAQRDFYQMMRQQGVRTVFIVYDLLCVLLPQYFSNGASEAFARWLNVVSEGDGAICISKAVSDELLAWVETNKPASYRPFNIDWFHLGADFDSFKPSLSLPASKKLALSQLSNHPSFLIVGTIEPRKAHEQVLDAFEQLWREGLDINLLIVGKQGWMVDNLVTRLRSHPELNKRLLWLEAISDEYLERVYAASTCLIAASYGEGFGLPLIEAAQHKLPIIARDIPVFREVAGEHAYYFKASTSDELAQSITAWLNLYETNSHPKSDEMPWLKWRESAENLIKIILGSANQRYTKAPVPELEAGEYQKSDLLKVNKAELNGTI